MKKNSIILAITLCVVPYTILLEARGGGARGGGGHRGGGFSGGGGRHSQAHGRGRGGAGRHASTRHSNYGQHGYRKNTGNHGHNGYHGHHQYNGNYNNGGWGWGGAGYIVPAAVVGTGLVAGAALANQGGSNDTYYQTTEVNNQYQKYPNSNQEPGLLNDYDQMPPSYTDE